MNYKLEKFWNFYSVLPKSIDASWTINLKSFEILMDFLTKTKQELMNYKLEKFWNSTVWSSLSGENSMNYKLEKFWNLISSFVKVPDNLWTINLKSFEIFLLLFLSVYDFYEL